VPVTDTVTIEQMVADLLAAGWERVRITVWRRPDGELFLGPAGAWKILQRGESRREK
jgi:hypothetical protein